MFDFVVCFWFFFLDSKPDLLTGSYTILWLYCLRICDLAPQNGPLSNLGSTRQRNSHPHHACQWHVTKIYWPKLYWNSSADHPLTGESLNLDIMEIQEIEFDLRALRMMWSQDCRSLCLLQARCNAVRRDCESRQGRCLVIQVLSQSE